MITVQDAENVFRQMLIDEGHDLATLHPTTAWNVFKRFVQLAVNCTHDGILFQCGVYDFTGEDLFYFDFVRQFSIDADGDYDHMEQLHCEFTCPPDETLRALETNLWAEEFDSLQDYFVAVESLREFQVALQYPSFSCTIYQEEV